MTLVDKYKKVDKEFVLSDSTVNEYGFRLLTDGYQMDAFNKNPIGYYMHRREDGVVLKWDNLRIENDQLIGTPVINLSNERGMQTCDEVENGFLNAASVGHIVVLEYSTDPEMMLAGQTGPTITKWYNKECSLVDIPGNCNALTRLYDAQENELNLADFTNHTNITNMGKLNLEIDGATLTLLNLAAEAKAPEALQKIKDLASENAKLESDNGELLQENTELEQTKRQLQKELKDLKAAAGKTEIDAMLDKAVEDKKITPALKTKLAADYATNPTGLKDLLAAMPAYQSIVDGLKGGGDTNVGNLAWTWDDYKTKDADGKKLAALKANNPDIYKKIFNEKFGE